MERICGWRCANAPGRGRADPNPWASAEGTGGVSAGHLKRSIVGFGRKGEQKRGRSGDSGLGSNAAPNGEGSAAGYGYCKRRDRSGFAVSDDIALQVLAARAGSSSYHTSASHAGPTNPLVRWIRRSIVMPLPAAWTPEPILCDQGSLD